MCLLSVILFSLFINPKINFAYFKSCIPFTHESTRRKGIRDIKTENIILHHLLLDMKDEAMLK